MTGANMHSGPEQAKLNSAVVNVIIHTCAFLLMLV